MNNKIKFHQTSEVTLVMLDNVEYLIIWQLTDPLHVGLKEISVNCYSLSVQDRH